MRFHGGLATSCEDSLAGMYLPLNKAVMIVKLLVEGSSVPTIDRITGVHHGTILKLLVLVGEKCERIMAEKVRNVKVRDVHEVWGFIGQKENACGRNTIKILATATPS